MPGWFSPMSAQADRTTYYPARRLGLLLFEATDVSNKSADVVIAEPFGIREDGNGIAPKDHFRKHIRLNELIASQGLTSSCEAA